MPYWSLQVCLGLKLFCVLKIGSFTEIKHLVSRLYSRLHIYQTQRLALKNCNRNQKHQSHDFMNNHFIRFEYCFGTSGEISSRMEAYKSL